MDRWYGISIWPNVSNEKGQSSRGLLLMYMLLMGIVIGVVVMTLIYGWVCKQGKGCSSWK
jgi:heme/copper-type cytochrome/quinol oxidase subunit 2